MIFCEIQADSQFLDVLNLEVVVNQHWYYFKKAYQIREKLPKHLDILEQLV